MQISGIIADAHPEDAARSYSTLAEVYEEMGDRARALELYELAAELLRPEQPEPLSRRHLRPDGRAATRPKGARMPHTST